MLAAAPRRREAIELARVLWTATAAAIVTILALFSPVGGWWPGPDRPPGAVEAGWWPGHEPPPGPAVTAATEGLRLFQQRATEHPEHFGFKEPGEVQLLTLGEGVQVYTMDDQRLPEAHPEDFAALFRPRDEWLFFVLLEGDCRSMLRVARDGDTYRTISMGNNPEPLHTHLQQAAREAGADGPPPRVVEYRGMTLVVPLLGGDTIWVATHRDRSQFGLTTGAYPSARILRALRRAADAPPPADRLREPSAASEALLPLAATAALVTAGAARFACGLTQPQDEPEGEGAREGEDEPEGTVEDTEKGA